MGQLWVAGWPLDCNAASRKPICLIAGGLIKFPPLRPPFDSDVSPYGIIRDSQGLQRLTAPKLYLRPSVLAGLDSLRRDTRVRDEHYPVKWKNTYGRMVGDSHVVYRPGVDLRATHSGLFRRAE